MLKMVAIVKYKMTAKNVTTSYFSAYFAILNIINMGITMITTIRCTLNSLSSSEAEIKTTICWKWQSFGNLDGSHFKIQDGCQKQQPLTFQVVLLQY